VVLGGGVTNPGDFNPGDFRALAKRIPGPIGEPIVADFPPN